MARGAEGHPFGGHLGLGKCREERAHQAGHVDERRAGSRFSRNEIGGHEILREAAEETYTASRASDGLSCRGRSKNRPGEASRFAMNPARYWCSGQRRQTTAWRAHLG